MKTTFLFAIARSGSLALSKMMNTDKCIAFHEGNDYETVGDKQFKFQYSYMGKQWLKAKEEGKNFFCCDISQPINSFKSYMSYLAGNSNLWEYIRETKILFIDSCSSCASRSLIRLMDTASMDNYAMTHLALEAQKQALFKCAKDLKEDIQFLVIDKGHDSTFTPIQVFDMNYFVGAWDLVNDVNDAKKVKLAKIAYAHHSMTQEQLINGAKLVNKRKDKPVDISYN